MHVSDRPPSPSARRDASALPPVASERHRVAEGIERAAWDDFFAAIPPDWASRYPAAVTPSGDASVYVLPAVPPFNRVLGLGVNEPFTDARLEEVLAVYRRADLTDFVLEIVPAALTAALRDSLARRGLRASRTGRYAKLWADTSRPIQDVSTTLRIVEATAEHANDFARVVQESFGGPPFFRAPFAALVGRKDWTCYVGYEHDAAVSVAATYARGSVGWVGMSATLASARGRGHQSATFTHQLREAQRAGLTHMIAEVEIPLPGGNNSSLNNLCRIACEVLYERHTFAWGPSARAM